MFKKHIVKVLTLLLFSCSLVQPLSTTRVLKSPTQRAKSTILAKSLRTRETVSCVVKTGYDEGLVNLRAGTGMTYDVLLVLDENTRLAILEHGDWFKVKTIEGVVGYINSKYCKTGE